MGFSRGTECGCVPGDDACVIYPSTFTDTQDGKPVIYQGTMTMALRKAAQGWVFTGAASAGGGCRACDRWW